MYIPNKKHCGGGRIHFIIGPMKHIVAKMITDQKTKTKMRFRNLLAASGKTLEDGEIRDLQNMYVMGRDGNLIKIADLNTDPDKQTEDYHVAAQADHGVMTEFGIPMPSIDKVFGHCLVWLEEDGLHARMFFANDDPLADHAYAIADGISYSIGFDEYINGYTGAGNEIAGPVGILREISMVVTGNDPRAKTSDQKAKATGSNGTAEADGDNNSKKGTDMDPNETKKNDSLTAEEVAKLKELANKVEATEGGNEGSGEGDDNKEDNLETTEPKADKKDTIHMNNRVVHSRVSQPKYAPTNRTTDYLKTDAAVASWGFALAKAGKDKTDFHKIFREIAQKRDGIDLGENISQVPEAVVNAIAEQLQDTESIIGHVLNTGLNFEVGAVPTDEGTTYGHIRGNTKKETELQGKTRVITPADLYRLIKLDHAMVKINGGLGASAIVKYVLNVLPRKLREAIDQAIVVGGIKNDDEGSTEFTAITSILSDIKGTDNIYATDYTAKDGDNDRATISKAAAKVKSGANRLYISTQNNFTDLENSMAGNNLLFPNGIDKKNPNINGIAGIITPLWLTDTMLGDYSGIVVDLNAFHTVGDTTPESLADYDIDVNKYVWEAVACIGGALMNANAAVGIKKAAKA